MKVGIITISRGANYGNKLQTYALQKVIESLGHEAFLVENNTLMHGAWFKCKYWIKYLIGYKNTRYDHRRKKSFLRFEEKYIKTASKDFCENYTKSNITNEIDAFVCGSDQVWNPHTGFTNGGCFAAFPNAKRRISFAASFGVTDIPAEQQEHYANWLNQMDAISVREWSGAEIVERLTGKKAQVHIDPTMMLTAKEWEEIEEMPQNMPEGKYIFRYFLGDVGTETEAYIAKLSHEFDLKIVDVFPSATEPGYYYNPAHFVYLIHHASIVVTDSFHASVFSLLFDRPFHVFERNGHEVNMSTRLDTLFRLFSDVSARNSYDVVCPEKAYYGADIILSAERERGYYFLREAFSVE